jgi:CheY-like chemotaxis protein
MPLPDLSDKQILVVEDDDMGYLYLAQLLKLTRCRLVRAKTGAEAHSFFQTMKFDLILMDIQLPDIDGLTVTVAIRSVNSTIPVIAQTAGKTVEDTDNALAVGCNAVLVKPLMMDKLFETLQNYL